MRALALALAAIDALLAPLLNERDPAIKGAATRAADDRRRWQGMPAIRRRAPCAASRAADERRRAPARTPK